MDNDTLAWIVGIVIVVGLIVGIRSRAEDRQRYIELCMRDAIEFDGMSWDQAERYCEPPEMEAPPAPWE